MTARAPSGDPWGYYGQQQTTAPEQQETKLEPLHTPDTHPSRTESSTEVMDTDEGQRTSARLLEEAQRLSQEAHTYVLPPQSWGDQGDTKHSKCLLLGGRRLNQNDFNPQTKRKWRRMGCDGPSRPSK